MSDVFVSFTKPTHTHTHTQYKSCSLPHVSAELRQLQQVCTPIFDTHFSATQYMLFRSTLQLNSEVQDLVKSGYNSTVQARQIVVVSSLYQSPFFLDPVWILCLHCVAVPPYCLVCCIAMYPPVRTILPSMLVLYIGVPVKNHGTNSAKIARCFFCKRMWKRKPSA